MKQKLKKGVNKLSELFSKLADKLGYKQDADTKYLRSRNISPAGFRKAVKKLKTLQDQPNLSAYHRYLNSLTDTAALRDDNDRDPYEIRHLAQRALQNKPLNPNQK